MSYRGPGRRVLLSVLALLLSVGAGTAAATPRFVLVEVAADEASEDRERALADELALVVDDVRVERRAPPRDDFGALGISEQVEALRATVMDPEILAAGWLDAEGPAAWQMVLVFAGEGRAVVQLVEAPAGEAGLPGLALAAREVLASALPLDGGPVAPAAEREPDEVPPPEPRFALSVGGAVGWGVARSVLPSPSAGGVVGGQLRLVDELWLVLAVAAVGASEPSTDTSALTVGPRLQLHWQPGSERVGFGPLVAVGLAVTRSFGGGPQSDLRDDEATRVILEPGVGARVRLAPRLELTPSFLALIGPELPLTKGRLVDDSEPPAAAVDLALEVALRVRL